MKPALLAASLVLVGGSAAACTGGSATGAPTDASQDDYCATYKSLFTKMSTKTDATDKQIVAEIKDWAERMRKTGTPKDIPKDARAGFETTISLIDDLDDDAKPDDFEKIDEGLSETETTQVDTFDTYTTDTCGSPLDDMEPPAMPESPAETPSAPAESPTQ
jgi:hypothetical protein